MENYCKWCYEPIPLGSKKRSVFCCPEHKQLYLKEQRQREIFKEAVDKLNQLKIFIDPIGVQHIPMRAIIKLVENIGYKWDNKVKTFIPKPIN